MREPTCKGCGCTQTRACAEGCEWVAPDLCSACVDSPEQIKPCSRARCRQQAEYNKAGRIGPRLYAQYICPNGHKETVRLTSYRQPHVREGLEN